MNKYNTNDFKAEIIGAFGFKTKNSKDIVEYKFKKSIPIPVKEFNFDEKHGMDSMDIHPISLNDIPYLVRFSHLTLSSLPTKNKSGLDSTSEPMLGFNYSIPRIYFDYYYFDNKYYKILVVGLTLKIYTKINEIFTYSSIIHLPNKISMYDDQFTVNSNKEFIHQEYERLKEIDEAKAAEYEFIATYLTSDANKFYNDNAGAGYCSFLSSIPRMLVSKDPLTVNTTNLIKGGKNILIDTVNDNYINPEYDDKTAAGYANLLENPWEKKKNYYEKDRLKENLLQ